MPIPTPADIRFHLDLPETMRDLDLDTVVNRRSAEIVAALRNAGYSIKCTRVTVAGQYGPGLYFQASIIGGSLSDEIDILLPSEF